LRRRSTPGRASTGRTISTADLPQGYQISQLYHPIVGEGQIEILLDEKDESSAKTIGIERIHIEQDAGKLMHDQHPSFSYVDLNRSASR
jgi:aspartyl-tRNA(Asn)/glutamyl-tRNA(Gln) amidotransferase subunit B